MIEANTKIGTTETNQADSGLADLQEPTPIQLDLVRVANGSDDAALHFPDLGNFSLWASPRAVSAPWKYASIRRDLHRPSG